MRARIDTRLEALDGKFDKLLESKFSCLAKILKMTTSFDKLLEML